MDRWRLQLVLETMEREQARPTLEDAFPWVGVLLAFLLAAIPNDFQDFFGIPGEVWTAIVIIGAGYSALRVLNILWRVWRIRNTTRQTAADLVNQIVEDMRQRRREIAAQQAQQQNALAASLGSQVGTPTISQSSQSTASTQPPTAP